MTPGPPLRIGRWTYYGSGQGLSDDVRGVSPDEGGNVYVAGTDALYAKTRDGDRFMRFDWENGGLSEKCNDEAEIRVQPPTQRFAQCPVVSVAGAAAGKAIVGYEGQGYDANGNDLGNLAEWTQDSGGADVVAFNGQSGTLQLTRHVLTGAPPHVVCDYNHAQWVPTCDPPPGTPPLTSMPWWDWGRRLVRGIRHIDVNHDPSSPMYGDAWMGGNHSTLSALLANAEARGWVDIATQFGPPWPDAKDFWEHLHPALNVTLSDGALWWVPGQCEAVSIAPDGSAWGSNGLRTVKVLGYGPDLSGRQYDMTPYNPGDQTNGYDFWTDDPKSDPVYGWTSDKIRALSHCADGTLWAGSLTHGLARLGADGTVGYLDLPNDSAGVLALACDRSDGSLWIGLASGGILRLSNGVFEQITVAGAPGFASQPVRQIQIDPWSGSPRVVYFAFLAATDSSGRITTPGGVASYDGP